MNECLEVGDNFMLSFFDTIIRFRYHSIGITADVEKAFLQIGISERDCNALQFLWFDKLDGNNTTIVQYRWTRLPFGITSSPSILATTL